jgi:hypothetical protein
MSALIFDRAAAYNPRQFFRPFFPAVPARPQSDL